MVLELLQSTRVDKAIKEATHQGKAKQVPESGMRQHLRQWVDRLTCTKYESTVPTQQLSVSTLEGTQHRARPSRHPVVPAWHSMQWLPGVAQLKQAPVSALDVTS